MKVSFSGIRGLAAGITTFALLAAVPLVEAQSKKTAFTDVPAGAFYEDAAAALLNSGALDSTETALRPSDTAKRDELVKLMVNLQKQSLVYPSTSSFNDVSLGTWYSAYMESAARAGWVHGDGNCYQQSRPCYARPASSVNRAEATALLVRTFSLQRTGASPNFPDVSSDQWYYAVMQTAADHCILQGDAGTGRARPNALMNRAEMVTMFYRASLAQQYGSDCGTINNKPTITSITSLSSRRVQVTFSTSMNATRLEDTSRYSIVRTSDGMNMPISSANSISSSSVDLDTNTDLQAGTSYTLRVMSMASQNGVVFSDNMDFTLAGVTGHITGASAVASNRIRLTFDTDLDATRAQQESRYTVALASNSATIGVNSAVLINSRTVELTLQHDLLSNATYVASAQSLLTSSQIGFSDSSTFAWQVSTSGHLTSVEALTSQRLRLTFDTPLDSVSAQQTQRYGISDGATSDIVDSALLMNDHTVELVLRNALQAQRSYTVNIQYLMTQAGVSFNDSHSVVYGGVTTQFTTSLMGSREVPSVSSTMTGTGSFTLTADGLQYDITLRTTSGSSLLSSITGAHFHQASAGTNGPVSQSISFSGNRATGTWTGMTSDQRNALLNGNIYVDVHTLQYPNGEIRGQLQMQ